MFFSSCCPFSVSWSSRKLADVSVAVRWYLNRSEVNLKENIDSQRVKSKMSPKLEQIPSMIPSDRPIKATMVCQEVCFDCQVRLNRSNPIGIFTHGGRLRFHPAADMAGPVKDIIE